MWHLLRTLKQGADTTLNCSRVQGGAYNEDTLCVGLARVGCGDQKIVAGPMKKLKDVDFGPPLHSLVIAGLTHVVEEELLALYRITSLPEQTSP